MALDVQRAVANAKVHFDSMTDDERTRWNQGQHDEHQRQHAEFRAGYHAQTCYLCGRDIKTVSKEEPCLHWLLRRGKFKNKDIKLIANKYGYFQIAAYLRWCANEEKFMANVNDLVEEAPAGKILSSTIKWKNIEWSFDCSPNDLAGHAGSHSDYPHYHFQMRIDGRQFINFNDFHLPFSRNDLFGLECMNVPGMHSGFGTHGAGMQDAINIEPEAIVNATLRTEEEGISVFHMSTVAFSADKPMRGEDIYNLMQESKATGRSMASLLHEFYSESDVSIQTTISPSDAVPAITSRTEHSKKS